jgi:hypothetical protein
MAERVWDAAGATVLQLLADHEDYELILTGHSLGAGTACLLNIMLQSPSQQHAHANRLLLPAGQTVRCFAYASPPVFSPLQVVPRAVLQSTTNYIHENDCVPFLSVHSVRHCFSCIRVLEDFMRSKQMGRLERTRLFWRRIPPPSELVDAIRRASSSSDDDEQERERLTPPKPGAPLLCIPAAASVWMQQDITPTSTTMAASYYTMKVCDPQRLARLGIPIHPNMLPDHSPARYEHALDNLRQK